MKKLLIALSICLGLSTLSSSALAINDTLFSKDKVKEDINFLVKNLEEVHPDLYANYSEDKFDADIASALESISEPISDAEIFSKFEPIISKLKDGHTGLRYSVDYYNSVLQSPDLMGLISYLKNGKIYFQNASVEHTDLYNDCEIISIDGVSTTKLYNDMISFVSGQNTSYRESTINRNFLAYYYLVNEHKDSYMIEIKNKNGNIEKITLPSVNLDDYKKLIPKSNSSNEYYSYKKINDNTICLTFNDFLDFDKFKVFIDGMFKEIQNESISNLIIDIRKNGGGNSTLGDLLIEHIYDGNFTQISKVDLKVSNQILDRHKSKFEQHGATNQEIEEALTPYLPKIGKITSTIGDTNRNYLESPVFSGNIYVLTSSKTFSSASMFAATIKDYNIGQLIGEETGGLATHFGDLYEFKLPNSDLRAFVSHKYFIRPNGLDTHRGVVPDYNIHDLGDKDALDIAIEIIENLKTK